MSKVHPKSLETGGDASVLTVWKKSLMFNCNGFTVPKEIWFSEWITICTAREARSFSWTPPASLSLPSAARLSLGDCWVVCEGETALKPQLTVRKRLNILKSKTLAYATSTSSLTTYNIRGSYVLPMYDAKQRTVGELIRKEGMGDDVFRLVVHSSLQSPIAMALVILLDQMFGDS